MGKRYVYTKVTPLPSNIPRQLALDMLHSHSEVIKLNPLVTGVKAIDAPRDAARDEFFSQWYEISEIITWGPGLKKRINFKGVFHDQPWGLQSHVYAPMGTDLRNKYRIGGNQPGEPREPKELGLDTPDDGLYLREDVEIICSVPLTMGFVKKETKAATGIMIDRLTKKAELLDEGKLHAMFENGKLRTTKPNQEPTFGDRLPPSPGSDVFSLPPASPGQRSNSTYSSPALDQQGFGRYHDIVGRQASHRQSSYVPPYQQIGYNGPEYTKQGPGLHDLPEVTELPGSFHHPEQQSPGLYPPPLKPPGQTFRSELPGDYMLTPPPLSVKRDSASCSSLRQLSPQPSPGFADQQSSRRSSSNYAVANPDPPSRPTHPSHRDSMTSARSTSQQALEQQQSHNSAVPVKDANPTLSPRTRSEHIVPDHERFSGMSIQQKPTQYQPYDPQLGSGMSKCPVCGLFEGDEAAVSHHVNKAHFA
ncbi:hypothetical protein KC352_g30291 [Hortaea werneckii]|uniref:DUF7053 domain-containing protein n=1 Tax=Hortaea werneckii EXF-2000 TaxID=1157616 RepID=A0A1Z5SYZ8_HORWE|nr:hypothetical protein KC358_g1219 [Hortaea werneckii]OTA27036.1 hypothetical protein BTJ68_12105 [Hortaea werneckii EXF-2000]KAI6929816.1 hypothetical protein KC341_g10637 [Hortaea werneckii]KAI6947749.1 hypothetical protein KC348_g2344 [Hortaea werneckii]KAI6981666.1 hypothetical protein KC321_g1088 [Hortaea werneckii]